jgi:hypothetical protein
MSPTKLTARYDLYLMYRSLLLNSISNLFLGTSYGWRTRSAEAAHSHGIPRYLLPHRLPVHQCLLPYGCKHAFVYLNLNPCRLKQLYRVAIWNYRFLVTAVTVGMCITNVAFLLYGT